MARLWGREWTKRERLERVGDLAQVAGVAAFTSRAGVRAGVRAARVRTGGGLQFTVLLSRGMDIAHAAYKDMPLAWISHTGEAHPHAFEPEGRGWLRTFYGGLVTTCGLSNAGMANQDGDEALGLHGRISHLPAEEDGAWTEWDGDQASVAVQGTLREARVFGENLRLTRKITAPVGEARMRIEDRVENAGFKTSPLMLLYHINFGWPLVSEDTEIVAPTRGTEPRDAVAEPGLAAWNRLEAPAAGLRGAGFFHDAVADQNGVVPVLLINGPGQIAVRVAYDAAALPYLTQWKMMGQGEYVCGIEPPTGRGRGRAAERAAGRLQTIAPGEIRHFSVTLCVLEGGEAIAEAEEEVRRLA